MEKKKCNQPWPSRTLKIGSHLVQNELDYFSDFMDCSNYKKYAQRIKKSLYNGHIPSSDRPSLSVTGILVEKFSEFCCQDGLDNLEFHEAASICYDACITPCSVIVALLYLDRLRISNPDYLSKTSPSQVFVVALMVASKYLYDDGEEDEVFNDEWATSAAMVLMDLNQAERNFLAAIDWNLYVDVKKFLRGLVYVEAEVSQREAASRGFYVYSDLVAISRLLPPLWNSILNVVGSAFVVCLVGYTATVTTIIAGPVVVKQCSMHIANHFEHIYLQPLSRGFNRTRIFEVDDDTKDTVTLVPMAIDNSEFVEDICNEIKSVHEPELPLKNLSGKFHALHTLTTAILLASSTASAKVADTISSLTYPSESSFSLKSAMGPCLNCLANSSYPSVFSKKKFKSIDISSKRKDRKRMSYSRTCFQKRIDKSKPFVTNPILPSDEGSMYSTNIFLPKKNVVGYEVSNSLIPSNCNSVISITEHNLVNYLTIASNGVNEKRLKSNVIYASETRENNFNNEIGVYHWWKNETERNDTFFELPVTIYNDYFPFKSMESTLFSRNKVSANLLDLLTSWMWKSVSSTSQNIHQLMNIGWQVQSVSMFI